MSNSNGSVDVDFDIEEFLGMPEYCDFELQSENILDTSICIYHAKSVSSDRQVLIKVSTVPNDEENAALEEEHRILTNLKQMMTVHTAPSALNRIKRRSGTFVRRQSISKMHGTIEDSFPTGTFPSILEFKRVCGDRCVAIVFEKFTGQNLESLIHADYQSNPKEIAVENSVTSNYILEEYSIMGLPLLYENYIPFDHMISVFYQIADVIDWLHRSKISLQNFSPSQVLVKRIPGKLYPVVQLTNFSLARKFDKVGEVQHFLDFRYISPEQTERMDRIPDYRADMYSFGISMWEAFTKEYPFADKDVDELIYCHLTSKTVDPRSKNPNIPAQLVEVIDKLIQKNPADRYQLFSAVKHDLKEILERCVSARSDHAISTTASIPDGILMAHFEKWHWNIGVKDFSPFLQFRAKTYGRKDQQTQILQAYETWYNRQANDRQGKVIVLSGDYGTGKSAFAEDLFTEAKPKAFPVASRPTKVQENAPYKAFMSIMEQLVAYVLGESNLSNWQKSLLEDLGTQGLRILHSLVPSISSVITEIDFSRGLGMAVNKLDLFKVAEIFLGEFSNYENPLLLCLGELDPSANDIEMLSYLLNSSLSYKCFFLFMLAPTENISSLKSVEPSMIHINIPPLILNEVIDFLDEILRPRLMEINSLASMLLQKSAGNLLYLKELVKHCEKIELISFDQNQLLWTWDLKKIEEEVGMSSDVVSLLGRQVESLPEKLKQCLAVASCIGLEFDVKMLSSLTKENVSQLNGMLHVAVTKGYIQPLSTLNPVLTSSDIPFTGSSQKIASTSTYSLGSSMGSLTGLTAAVEIAQRKYRFCHRRIREFLKYYIPKADFERYSLQIAQLLRKQKIDERVSSEQMFAVLNHYENSALIIKEDEDLYNYSQLLCDIGFQKGVSIEEHIQNFSQASLLANRIVVDSPQKQDLLFKINASLSKLYIRSDQLEKAEKLLKEIEPNSINHDVQKSEWTSLMVQLNVAKNLLKDAIEIGFNSNSSLSSIFQALSFSDPVQTLKKLSSLIANQEEIFAKPAANILTAQHAEEMIQNCIYLCKKRGDQRSIALFIMQGVYFSITEGSTDNSSYYFAAIVQYFVGSVFEYIDINSGRAFGELAMAFIDQVSPERKLATFDALLSGHTLFWNYTEASDKMHVIFNSNLEEKRVSSVIESMVHFYQNHFLSCGKTIGFIRDVDRKFRSNPILQNQDFHSWDITCRCFEDIASGSPILQYQSITTSLGKFNYYAQLLQAFLYFLPNRAQLCENFNEILSDFRSTWIYADALLCSIVLKCDELVRAGNSMNAADKNQQITLIDKSIALLNVYTQCQFSGEHRFKLSLAKAERERALGNIKEGIEKYEDALEGAQSVGNILFTAWIHELYANFWISSNAKRLSKTFLQSSISYWEQWGAEGKIEDIYGRFPEYHKRNSANSASRCLSINSGIGGRKISTRCSTSLPAPDDTKQHSDFYQRQGNTFSSNEVSSSSSSSRKPLDLDINTFLKVTNSITNEKDLDALVDKILRHLMSNTGATKAVILFNSEGTMTLHKILTNTGIESFNSAEPQNHVPMSLIHYTTRVSESHIHSEMTKESAVFNGDPYIEQFSPASIICCPIKHQNQTTGAIYLENRAQAGVFTTARIALVKSLMASASIAIANAHLEKKNLELSQALQESGKSKNDGPAFQVETPMQKVFEYVKTIKERFDPKDPIIKTFDSFLSTLTSDGLFAANLGEANDKDGKGIDQDVKNWVESSLLMTRNHSRSFKSDRELLPRTSTAAALPASEVIVEESNRNSSNLRMTTETSFINMERVNAELELINSPNFDCFRLHELTEGRPLFHLGNHMLKKYKLYSEFKLNPQTMEMFLQKIESSYNRLPYHNSIHATDVLQSVEMLLLNNNDIAKFLTPLETFSVCIASAVHDLDHPGINNNFLVKIGHPLALLYNDHAVLESHHIARAFEIAFLPKMTIFETMTPDQYTFCRKTIISIVMATDLAQHFQFISKFNGKVASSSLNLEDDNDRLLVMEMAVKCGDLGNPAKSFHQAKKWTNLVMEEFFRQGDREKQMRYPVSKFMDRLDTNVSKCQIGFIDFLVAPLFNSWTSFSKTEFTNLCQENIENNRKQWNLVADDPNLLPGVNSADYENLEDLINITVPSISFCKENNDIKRKSLRDSIRRFSVSKLPTFAPFESEDRKKQSPLLSMARQMTD